MNSWLASNHAGDEQPLNSHHSHGWSLTAASPSTQRSPNRREYAVQPPLLTTALSGSQFHSHGALPTPPSSTSLSSPFTLTQGQSPSVSSSGNARSASSSSMSSRHAPGYNVPYNPRDWGPVGGASAQGAYHPVNNMARRVPQQHTHTEMSLSPPPPPYSPPSNRNRMSQDSYGQPNLATPSPAASPAQNQLREANFELSPDYRRRSAPRPRPLSMIQMNDADFHRHSLPPPPPQANNRSISHSRLEAYQGVPYNSTASNHMSRQPISAAQYEQAQSTPSLRIHAPTEPASQQDPAIRPPTSRRAASAGAVVSSAGSSRSASQTRNGSPSNSGWEPGMPLPPPPPGPPPTTRSASVSGSSDSSARTPQASVRARARAPPMLGTGLGSIPPTPADWVDEEYINNRPGRDKEPLYIDTARAVRLPEQTDHPDSGESANQSQQTPGSGGLFRSPAIRDSSTKGIRERRIERRHRQSQSIDISSAVSSSGDLWSEDLDQIRPCDLVLPEPIESPNQTRHPKSSSKFTPLSTRSLGSEGQHTESRSQASSTGLFSDQSSHSTPKRGPRSVGPTATFAHTPPFSPGGEGSSSSYQKAAPQVLPPKALPTPPLNSTKEAQPRLRAPSRGEEDRPVSHILHLPNDAISMMMPLSPRRPITQQSPQQTSSLESIIMQDTSFVNDALERYKAAVEKEANAPDEVRALKIFTDFILVESQIRRQRYARACESERANIDEVRRNLFEVPPPARQPLTPTPVLEIPPIRAGRPESAWWNNYQPCLSPIVSMSNDEMSSRGRAPSRWWESKTGSSSAEGNERKVQRSKRESKYMGLPLEAMQWDLALTPSKPDDGGGNYTGHNNAAYRPDQYPPEKADWHEQHPGNYNGRSMESQRLDISRLVTLPPPYPRHHPAVNNSHPDLVSYRTTVRSVTDLSEIKSTRQRYQAEIEKMIQEHQDQVKDDHRQFKSNIQGQIQAGSLTFAEAAEAEAAMIAEDNKRERELEKRQLDMYQDMVLNPMHTILTDRIARATACINELSSKLFDDAQNETPDQTQGEGDEKPELLEKLTQLKWLFEAREQLHREAFDLVSDRDEKYKDVALLPYKQNNNEDKIRETQAFFSQDTLDRKVEYETAAVDRFESFLDIIEQNAVRGVEVQLSAFWDIAPSLVALVQQVPERLGGFQVRIPTTEYAENPSYHAHPLQYLYSLLCHAERSSYQYIESQTNLLCLLHEVRSAVMRANRNLVEAERNQHGETAEDVQREMQDNSAEEELTLTTDLKDKVATVEGQWAEALGSQIQGLRERVREQLVVEDGWDDMEQLEQE